MEHIKDNGIVLAIQPLKDSDLILRLLTENHGRIDVVAKRARSPKSPFFGYLDLFNVLDVQVKYQEERELHILQECSLRLYPNYLSKSLISLEAFTTLIQVIERMTEKQVAMNEIYQVAFNFLSELKTIGVNPHHIARTYMRVEIETFRALGLISDKLPQELQEGLELSESEMEPSFCKRYHIYMERISHKNHMNLPKIHAVFFTKIAKALDP